MRQRLSKSCFTQIITVGGGGGSAYFYALQINKRNGGNYYKTISDGAGLKKKKTKTGSIINLGTLKKYIRNFNMTDRFLSKFLLRTQ